MADRWRRVVRVGTAALAGSSVLVGAWALAAPRSFYDDFPGGGRAWVSVDGPFNEHLVRDVGGLNLTLAFVLAAAAVTLSRPLVLAALVGSLFFAVPHLAYHLAHLDTLDATDQVAQTVSLALAVVVPIVLVPLARRLPPHGGGVG
jgi:hypothetical protein